MDGLKPCAHSCSVMLSRMEDFLSSSVVIHSMGHVGSLSAFYMMILQKVQHLPHIALLRRTVASPLSTGRTVRLAFPHNIL
jgi:hypothetical protein